MQNNIAQQTIGRRSQSLPLSQGYSASSAHLRPDLCDRFQGALLGLSLAPVALSSVRLEAIAKDACIASSRLHQAIEYSRAQTSAFVSAPNTWRIAIAELPYPTFFLPACVPVLLRYHHSWRKRLDRLRPLQFQLASLEGDEGLGGWDGAIAAPFRQRLAQALVLGDLLEAIISETSALLESNWIAWLTDCAARYRSVPLIFDQYNAVLSALSAQMEERSDLLPVEEVHQAFAMGVSSAMLHPQSYVLALRRLLDCASIQTAFSGQSPDGLGAVQQSEVADEFASVWTAVFAAGLLAGAWNGKCGLPTLWQMCPVADNPALLASDLFCLWAGQPLGRGVL